MSTTVSVFASPGARAEHYLIGPGRLTDLIGRVLRARLERLRRRGWTPTHDGMSILREAERMRNSLRARAERTRLLVGQPVF